MVWLGVQAGIVENIFKSDGTVALINRLRATLPLWAAFLAAVLLVVRFYKQRSGSISFFGPLGLLTVYGLVGLAASFLSPDGSVALYWAAAYLSVPLVLWGIAWGRDELGTVHRIVKLNWLILILAVLGLFAVALLYLDLGKLILTPSLWFDCSLYRVYNGNSWHDFSSGLLRPTGVGRYAGLAAILALGGLLSGRGRWLWAFILFTSLILLLTSGARGAFVGFAAAATLIGLFYGGKKAVVWGGLGIAVLVPVVWSTGIHQQFLDLCIFREEIIGSPRAPESSLYEGSILLEQPIRVTIPTGQWVLEEVVVDPKAATEVFARALIPLGLSIEIIQAPEQPSDPGDAQSIRLPAGYWELKPAAQPEQADSGGSDEEPPRRISVAPGPLTLEHAAQGEAAVGDGTPKIYGLSGRTSVWEAGFRLFKERPIMGFGFHADRLLLETHMHNTLMHALVQTGLVGTIPLVIALLYGWLLLIKALSNRANLPELHRHLLIQVMGVLVFFSFRTFTESTGAFFGVDWLLLAPLLLYLQVVSLAGSKAVAGGESPSKKSLISWKSAVSRLRQSPGI